MSESRRSRPPGAATPQGKGETDEVNDSSSITYQTVLDNAKDVLVHIKNGNVLKPSRYEKTSIIYYDFYDPMNQKETTPVHIDNSKDVSLLASPPEGVKDRLIIVEDLSRDTIHALGSTFWLNPEFFEEHLLNSGYAGPNYTQRSARTWKTDSLAKSYVSIKWFRPAWLTRTYFSSRDLVDLLADGTEYLTRSERIISRAVTNIFRSGWGLRMDPTKTIRTMRECGWEEKATIWVGNLSGCYCQFVIALLDPLPEISERKWSRRKDPTNEDGGADNVSRRSYRDEGSDVAEDGFADIFPTDEDNLPRRASERGVTPGLRARTRMFLARPSKERAKLIKRKDADFVKEKRIKPPRRVIIEQMSPRQALDVDLDKVFQEQYTTEAFINDLTQPKSTRREICDILDGPARAINFIPILFQIIHRDTSTLLEQLYRILDEIDVEVVDETKMEDRLILWRQLINRAQGELPELKTSLRRVAGFFQTVYSSCTSEQTANTPLSDRQEFKRLLEDIARMTERLQKTSESLTSNMSLLESRRSIDEAHAVTRLTELAFIFIPLSFAASIFGMQVQPFANPVPIWYFFVVAIVATTFSYTMRLVMRSQAFNELKADIKYDIRKYAERHGQPVQLRSLPLLFILQWAGSTFALGTVRSLKWTARTGQRTARTGQRTAKHLYRRLGFIISLILLVGAVSALPIGILFTRRLDPGIQTAVSIGIILAISAIVGIPFLHRSRPTWKSAFPKLPAALTTVPRWARRGFLWLIPIATLIVIPLALIWTRSLDSGIKVGLTIGISIVAAAVLGVAFVYRSRRFYFTIRTRRSTESDQGSSYEDNSDTAEFSSGSI